MGTAIGDLVVNLLGNGAPLAATLNSSAAQVSEFAAKTRGLLMGGLNFLGVGGIFLGGGLAASMLKTIGLAGEQARAEKKLESVLQSTGHAAGFGSSELKKYAAQLQAVTNYGDEATIAGMSVMATFTNVRGDVFKEAIASAQDLSTIMGQDLQASIVQIGKALNDPIKGITALSRVGVSFSQQQKAAIKEMVQSGDVVGAQRAILAELQKEFGGAAKNLASPMTQLKNAVGDLGEELGKMIGPPVKAAAVWLRGWVEQGIEAMGRFREAVQPLGEAIAGAWTALRESPAGAFLTHALQAAALGAAIIGMVKLAVSGFSMLSAAVGIFTSPIGLAIAAVAALGALFVQLTGEGETFGEKLQSVLSKIPAVIDDLAFGFRNVSSLAQLGLIEIVLAALEYFPQMEGPMASIAKFFMGTWAGLKAFFGAIIDNMIGGLKEVGNVLSALWEGIKAAWGELTSGNWSGIGTAFTDAFSKTLAEQKDVKAPSAFAEFGKAYKEAADQFQQKMDASGGFKAMLQTEREGLVAKIAADEAARQAQLQQQKAEEKVPAAAAIEADKKAAKQEKTKELAGAAERGSKEAWSIIAAAMFRSSAADDPAVQAAEATADNTERIAAAVEQLAGEAEIEI